MIWILLALSAYVAWRYSQTSIDPDWAYFNLWGFTGSVYGRDFADCKTPAVHLWYLGLSKIVGKSAPRVKFANHFLIGSVGAVLYLLTGDFWAALAYTVLVNSGWLLAFHGNVGQLPAALIAMALALPEPFSLVLWVLAVLYEPKLAPSFVVLYWYAAPAFAALGVAAYIVLRNKQWFRWIWESSVTIPMRMARYRRGDFRKLFMPWFTSAGTLYLAPWIFFAVIARPDFFYWLPALVYGLIIVAGKVVRQNHLIPLIPFIAMSGTPYVWVFVLVDFLSAGFYLGNIWGRFYSALDGLNEEAEKVGAWLSKRPGTVYVNGIHSGIYVHAARPVQFGFAEQIEIREVAKERREEMVRRWREAPPDWVVDGKLQGIRFKPSGYQRMVIIGDNIIYKKS